MLLLRRSQESTLNNKWMNEWEEGRRSDLKQYVRRAILLWMFFCASIGDYESFWDKLVIREEL